MLGVFIFVHGFTNCKNKGDRLTGDRLESMATLQRSNKVFRRQGSSGEIWDESFLLGNDKIDYRELRPCQSGSNIRNMDCSSSSSIDAPSSCPRSLSTPAMKQTSCKGSATENRSGLPIPKSRSGNRNRLLGILSGHN